MKKGRRRKLQQNIPSRVHPLLLRWYRKNGRTFLWRKKNISPYTVLVSEFMLQQTQASRVEEKLPLFLKKFPTITTLARSSQHTVLKAWQGMGYNNRALRLHKCAKEIVHSHNAKIPDNVETLITLPGIGRYTARAIALFAFNKREAPLDVNIARVLTRLTSRVHSVDEIINEKHAWALAEKFLPASSRDAHDWSQALMDMGARFCTKRAPKCYDCPLLLCCSSARERWPAPQAKKETSEPRLGNVPRRIIRGKIVELLRARPATQKEIFLSLREKKLQISPKETEHVLLLLERDEIISVGKKISLKK